MEQQTLNIGIGYTPEATPENAGAIRTAMLMGFIQLSQKYPSSKVESEMARMALQWIPTEAPQIGSLEGLREALLAPRTAMRDPKGWLTHDALPLMDEGTHIGKFLEAFGLEYSIASMESQRSEYFERWCEEGSDDCLEWEPEPPVGNGWRLLEIYMGEEDCYALYIRDWYEAERERKQEARASRRAAYEHNLQHAAINSIDV